MAESTNPFDLGSAEAPQAPAATEPAAAEAPLDAAFFSAAPGAPQPETGTNPSITSGTATLPDGQGDARIAWRAENMKALEAKEEQEKKENDAVKVKAQEWLKRFNEERTTRIEAAKKNNQAQEQAATTGPQGNTPWEKVNSMIDFTFKPPQEMEGERERFKKILFNAKDKNVPCPV